MNITIDDIPIQLQLIECWVIWLNRCCSSYSAEADLNADEADLNP